jgi:L,D-peptidoglycan transpeptidase YkuD (ErfK/YbiS/YcfS/YnhG family)
MNLQTKSVASCCLLTAVIICSATAQRHSTLSSVQQLIVVTTADWSAVDGQLQRYQRTSSDDAWNAVGHPVSVVVGSHGMGWGIGAVPTNSMRSFMDPTKREGDQKSPAGIFRFGEAFGYAPQEPQAWKVHYLPLTAATQCVDDPQSRFYNRILDSSTVTPDWKSAEHMRDVGEAYRWGIVIEHNFAPAKPQAGSCVFMHIWSGPGIGTEGCIAMPEPQLKSILAWLNPQARPLLVQMPLSQYRMAVRSLHLPAPVAVGQ